MPDMTKIATCSFCGTRAILKLRELSRHHELSCSNCAAPLHEMKPMKVQTKAPKEVIKTVYVPFQKKRHKPKKRRNYSWINRAVAELWDELEDIIDID